MWRALTCGGAHPREATEGGEAGEEGQHEQVEVVGGASDELVVSAVDGAHGDVLCEEAEANVGEWVTRSIVRGDRRPPVAIRGDPRRSVAIRGEQVRLGLINAQFT